MSQKPDYAAPCPSRGGPAAASRRVHVERTSAVTESHPHSTAPARAASPGAEEANTPTCRSWGAVLSLPVLTARCFCRGEKPGPGQHVGLFTRRGGSAGTWGTPSTAMGLHRAPGHVRVHEGLVWTEEQFSPVDVRLRVTPTVGLPLVTVTLMVKGASDMKKVSSAERSPE